MDNKDFINKLRQKADKVPIPNNLAPDNVKQILRNKKLKKGKKLYAGLSAAACILLCIFSLYIWRHTNSNDFNDSLSYDGAAKEANHAMDGEAINQGESGYEGSPAAESDRQDAGIGDSNGNPNQEAKTDPAANLAPSSYDEVKKLLMDNANRKYNLDKESDLRDYATSAGKNTVEYKTSDTESSGDYSETNTQVKGVDEADILKTDGKYLYAVKERESIVITKANDGKMSKVSEIHVAEDVNYDTVRIEEMYLDGDRLTVMCSTYTSSSCLTLGVVYTITPTGDPVFVNVLSQDGYYSSSRKSGDYVYTFSNHYVYNLNKKSKEEDYIPRGKDGKLIPYSDIVLPEQANESSFLVVTVFNVNSPTDFTDQKSILAASGIFYVSEENIYATSTIYNYEKEYSKSKTQVIQIPYKEGSFHQPITATVPGTLNNSFSMDEYDGYLRMVTHIEYFTKSRFPAFIENDDVSLKEESREDGVEGEGNGKQKPIDTTPYNALYVLDADLNITGSISNLAPGESIYSARFFGETGYFVTFRNIDPLFSVDLSNPKKPKILGELKIPGFSNYLHFYSENLLLGIGMEVKEKTSEMVGLKLSMFDISDPANVKETDKLVLSEYAHSPALYNHKAVLVDTNKNLFGFTAIGYYNRSGNQQTKITNPYLLYSYRNGFEEKASYDISGITKEGYDENDVRGAYIGDYIYITTGRGIRSYSLKTNKPVDTLRFY